MELIVINENKFKIMMDKNDMKIYGLDEDEFYLSVTNTRDILERILKSCPEQRGFESIAPEDKLLMQLYPERNGGCELFITRLCLDNTDGYEEESIFMSCANEDKYLLPRCVKKGTEQKKTSLTYSFKKLDYVFRTCKELKKREYSGNSALYRGEDEKYYLILTPTQKENEKSSPSSCLSEFGELENSDSIYLLLLERGHCICKENAVEIASEL